MNPQIPLSAEAIAEMPHPDDHTHQIRPDVAYLRLAMVNVVFVGLPQCGDREWVLIDAGVTGMRGRIRRAAEERFGKNVRPAAIVLTHGHFDHVGCLEKLAEEWDTPVYAHVAETPYLDGSAAYPPPDPTVGGGIMPMLSPLFPRDPVDVGARLRVLAEAGTLTELPGWKWLHTPGHTPGHVSLWRESDGCLIAGDAFITTRQESAYAVAMQSPELHGPPAYFTPDWEAAEQSVKKLAALSPQVVVTGHGRAMEGEEMQVALKNLAANFREIAVPAEGRYVLHPATPKDGSAYRKPH